MMESPELAFTSAAAAFAPPVKRITTLKKFPTASDYFRQPGIDKVRTRESPKQSDSPGTANSDGGPSNSAKSDQASREPHESQGTAAAQPKAASPHSTSSLAEERSPSRPLTPPLIPSEEPSARSRWAPDESRTRTKQNGEDSSKLSPKPERDSWDSNLDPHSSNLDSDTIFSPPMSPPPNGSFENQTNGPFSKDDDEDDVHYTPNSLRLSSDKEEDVEEFAKAYRAYLMENGPVQYGSPHPASSVSVGSSVPSATSITPPPEQADPKPQEESAEPFKITRDLAREAILDDLQATRRQSESERLRAELEKMRRAYDKDMQAWKSDTLKLKLELRRIQEENVQRAKEQRQRFFRERHELAKLTKKSSVGTEDARTTVDIGVQASSLECGAVANAPPEELAAENAMLRREVAKLQEENERVMRQIQAKKANTYGNTAFSQGKFEEALKHYATALDAKMEDPNFNCVLLCNRSAASRALARNMDALADSMAAVRVDTGSARALQARADILAAIGDFEGAIDDWCQLESKHDKEASKKLQELRRRQKLQVALGSPGTLDFYAILSVAPTSPCSDIKNAYKRLALRHHPDRAGPDANLVFKYIAQAYQVLSDQTLRVQYDQVHASLFAKGANGKR